MTPGDRLLADTQVVVGRALATHAHLLTAGEAVVAERLMVLSGPPGRAWARLIGRKRSVFRPRGLRWDDVPEPAAAVAALQALGLVHGGVPWDRRVPLFTVPELKAAAARLGLPVSGRRAELEERLVGQTGWSDEPVLRVGYRRLLRRLELLAFATPFRDRRAVTLDRIGVIQRAKYTPTGGPSLFPDRAGLKALEAAMVTPEVIDPEALLASVQSGEARPIWLRRLDPRRWQARLLFEAAQVVERGGELERAEALYQGLLDASRPGRAVEEAALVKRLALTRERLGRPGDGAGLCELWRDRIALEGRPGLERTGRRLARKAKRPWRPARPLRQPPARRLQLPPGPKRGGRPTWGDPPLPVEAAVIRALAPRRALHSENWLWTTLFGLVFDALYWAPVPGMLPAAALSGPLDLGTPAFVEHRREAFEAHLARIVAGEAPAMLRATWDAREGQRVRGVAWTVVDRETLAEAAEGLGGAVLVAVLRRLGEEGWRAARGLPDLLVLPGPAGVIAGAVPASLDAGVTLAEIKGPTDSLRDAQRVWLDALLRAGARVELWNLRADKES